MDLTGQSIETDWDTSLFFKSLNSNSFKVSNRFTSVLDHIN
jgi:hypothetical protein